MIPVEAEGVEKAIVNLAMEAADFLTSSPFFAPPQVQPFSY